MQRILPSCLALCALLIATAGLRADEKPDSKAIIDKAIKAHGGQEKLAKFQASSTKTKGKYYGMGDDGLDYTAKTDIQLPDKIRNEIHAMDDNFIMIQIFDGKKGWTKEGDDFNEMPEDALAGIKETLQILQVGHLAGLLDKDYTLTSLGDSKVADKEAVGVKVARKDRRDVSLYFDKKTGMLLKSESKVKSFENGGDDVKEEKLYENYKEVEGIKIPHKVTVLREGKKYVESEVTEAKLAEKLDAKVFAKP